MKRKLFLDNVLPKVIIKVQSHWTKNTLQSSQSVVINLKVVFLGLFFTVKVEEHEKETIKKTQNELKGKKRQLFVCSTQVTNQQQ